MGTSQWWNYASGNNRNQTKMKKKMINQFERIKLSFIFLENNIYRPGGRTPGTGATGGGYRQTIVMISSPSISRPG